MERPPRRYQNCKIGFVHNCNCAHLQLCRKGRRGLMARGSILSAAPDEQHTSFETVPQAETIPPAEIVRVPTVASISSRHAKLHVGGYFDPYDPTLVAF